MQHHLGLSPVSFCPTTGRFSSPRAELWLTINPLGQHKPAPPETTENFVVIFREKKPKNHQDLGFSDFIWSHFA